jgi:hypothetical protein
MTGFEPGYSDYEAEASTNDGKKFTKNNSMLNFFENPGVSAYKHIFHRVLRMLVHHF